MILKTFPVLLGGFFVMAGVLFAFPTEKAWAQLIFYDNFNSGNIDPEKWLPRLRGSGTLELVRQVKSGRLFLANRVMGETTTDTGQNKGYNELRFLNRRTFTSLRFQFQVNEVNVQGCEAPGSSISRSFAGFTGVFFNDGSSTEAGDLTGDVGVFIIAERRSDSEDAEGRLQLKAGLFRCVTPSCSQADDFSEVSLGVLLTGQQITLKMRWDQDRQRFIFRRGSSPAQVSNYTQDVVAPRNVRDILVRGDAAHCTVSPRPVTSMTAIFDNIFITP